jgi:hypothetical protein
MQVNAFHMTRPYHRSAGSLICSSHDEVLSPGLTLAYALIGCATSDRPEPAARRATPPAVYQTRPTSSIEDAPCDGQLLMCSDRRDDGSWTPEAWCCCDASYNCDYVD